MVNIGRMIGRWSFDFPTKRVSAVTSAGSSYQREVWCGMPAIPPMMLKSTFYLYATRRDAERGDNSGGSGFFLGIPSNINKSKYHVVALSNWHVAVDGYPVIRINKKGGGIDIMEFDCSEWIFKPKWHDIAALPVRLDDNVHDTSAPILELLPTKELVEQSEVGPGDEIFMVGRFMDHDGGPLNLPSVRFGNLSMMPVPIEQPTGATLESYVVDMHSRSGYSGSPVFAYRTIAGNVNQLFTSPGGIIQTPRIMNFLFLLGILWGQFPEQYDIARLRKVRKSAKQKLINVGQYIEGMSGMSCVVPSWAIRDLLEHPKIRHYLDEEDQKIRDDERINGSVPRPMN